MTNVLAVSLAVITQKLGHQMSPWALVENRWHSYCVHCDDYAEVWATKVFGKSQVTGAAVVLPCKGKR